jgi:hypothetical protein
MHIDVIALKADGPFKILPSRRGAIVFAQVFPTASEAIRKIAEIRDNETERLNLSIERLRRELAETQQYENPSKMVADARRELN